MDADPKRGFSLSEEAKEDLLEIVVYTVDAFGEHQSLKYKQGIYDTCQKLADNPYIGRTVEILEGLRQFRYKSHIIFYKPSGDNILIVRLLGGRMDTDAQLIKQ